VDFFERSLGISPDGGDGSAELLFLVVLFAIIALIAWRLLGLPNVKDDASAASQALPAYHELGHSRCPLMTQSEHSPNPFQSPGRRRSNRINAMSAIDPKRRTAIKT
jgi:hypothetical protein